MPEPASPEAGLPEPASGPVARHRRKSLEERQRRLRMARRRATAFLVVVTLVFIGVTVAGVHGTFLGYVQAGAEAAMVLAGSGT